LPVDVGLVRPREAVPLERGPYLVVVLEGDGRTRVGVGEDLVEQVEPVAPDVELEQAAVALQPRPGNGAVAVLPDPDRPLVLAALVLAQPPR
jgi:hypothetical protein